MINHVNFDPANPEPGIFDISNDIYRSSKAINKSKLDHIESSPGVYQWSLNAPSDPEKMKALDFGTAIHAKVLEPDLFYSQYISEPIVNKRTNVGKDEIKKFYKKNPNATIITADDFTKLRYMYDSIYAHPTARNLLEKDGLYESSIFWTDEETGELCKVRPDKVLTNENIIVDLKKTDYINNFSKSIEEFRYHVQDAMYSDGYYNHFGDYPTFALIAVSSTISCGKYPVRVFILSDKNKEEGHRLYRKNMLTYSQCKKTDEWNGFEIIDRPRWAKD